VGAVYKYSSYRYIINMNFSKILTFKGKIRQILNRAAAHTCDPSAYLTHIFVRLSH
jgi:hypothetical protein